MDYASLISLMTMIKTSHTSRSYNKPFCTSQDPMHERRGDPKENLNTYKTQISFRDTSLTLKYSAIHIILSGVVKKWYYRI